MYETQERIKDEIDETRFKISDSEWNLRKSKEILMKLLTSELILLHFWEGKNMAAKYI